MEDNLTTRVVHPEGVFAALLQFTKVPVLNISKGGVFLEMERPLVIGHQYLFQIDTNSQQVVLDGRVVRCHLNHLEPQASGEQQPRYNTAVEFHIPHHEKVDRLAHVIRKNTLGEKRGSVRIRPTGNLWANIAQDIFSRVLAFSMETLTVEGKVLLDMDQDWPILFQVGEESIILDAHIVQGSRKEGASQYQMVMEFLNPSPDQVNFLRRALARPEHQQTSGSESP